MRERNWKIGTNSSKSCRKTYLGKSLFRGAAAGVLTTATPPTNVGHVATPAGTTPAGDATDPAAVRRVGGGEGGGGGGGGGGGEEMEIRYRGEAERWRLAQQKPAWEVEEEGMGPRAAARRGRHRGAR